MTTQCPNRAVSTTRQRYILWTSSNLHHKTRRDFAPHRVISMHHKTHILHIEQSASQDSCILHAHRTVSTTRHDILLHIGQSPPQDTIFCYTSNSLHYKTAVFCTSNSLHHKTAVFCTSNSLHQKTAVVCGIFFHIRNFARNNCHSISEEQSIHSLNKCTMKYSACKYNDEVNCTHDTCTGQRSGAKNASV